MLTLPNIYCFGTSQFQQFRSFQVFTCLTFNLKNESLRSINYELIYDQRVLSKTNIKKFCTCRFRIKGLRQYYSS